MDAVDVNAVNANGATAVMVASEMGHLNSVQHLYEIKADLSICSDKFGTVMHRAALDGHTKILKVTLGQ